MLFWNLKLGQTHGVNHWILLGLCTKTAAFLGCERSSLQQVPKAIQDAPGAWKLGVWVQVGPKNIALLQSGTRPALNLPVIGNSKV